MVFLGVYRAIYDYTPQGEEELEIKDGDLLLVLEKSAEDDWWKAKKKASNDDDDEPEGLIPANYVEEAKATHHAKALYDYTKQTDEELSFHEDARVDVYDTTDPDWTLVGRDGAFGFVPAAYIEVSSSHSAAPAGLAPPPMPARPEHDADEPIPGEPDYPDPGMAPTPSPEPPTSNPAAALAGIIAQRTGGAAEPSYAAQRSLASPPPMASPQLPSRPQYTPEESEEEEAPPPSLPNRPASQAQPPLSPPPTQYASAPRISEPAGVMPSPPYNRAVSQHYDDEDVMPRSPGGFHLYNIHEMVSHMGKNKKMPTTLGINVAKGMIMISPEKSRDGPSQEWTAEKLTHYSIEGKHVFVELIRPSKSVDFHAGAKDTAQEIVSQLGDLAGAVRQEGLREVIAASAGTGAGGIKKGHMLYEFMAQSEDEITVAAGDEVIVLDDHKSDEWWMVRRMKNGKEGVVPASYVEITGTLSRGSEAVTGLNAARSTVEQNRLEEERLARDASKKDKKRSDSEVGPGMALPERHSSLAGDSRRGTQRETRSDAKRPSKDQAPKSKPNGTRLRTWTDRSGTFKVEAEFIGLREGKIHLHKTNGVKIAVPVTKMAVEDLEYVERATGQSLDDDKPLSDIKRRSTLKQKEREQRNGGRAGASVQKQDEYDWFDFFLQCGVNPQICERYGAAFSRDQMGPEVLPDVNEQLLRTLGLKEGDILRVMKFLDNKYDRKTKAAATPLPPPETDAEAANGGLFSGPGGTLRNNTRKGRPAPAVQTNDVVDEKAFRSDSPAAKGPPADAQATPLTSAPARQPTSGFDDDAWDVKPARTQTPAAAAPAPAPAPPAPAPEPPKPAVNNDILSLSLSSPPLQPTAAPAPAPAPPAPAPPAVQQPPQQPQGANQAIFDKIASLAPQPTGFPQNQYQPTGNNLGMPQPPRAASAPGFQPQRTGFGQPPLQAQLTGYQPQMQPQMTGFPSQGQSLADLQRYQQMQAQATGFPGQGFQQQQPNAFMPQPTGLQAMQQQFPAMQPQPTGFMPQSQFGQSQFGMPQQQQPMQTGYSQAMANGQQTGSPFADPPHQPFQAMPSGLSNSFQPQQTGFPGQMQQPQPTFNISQPTGGMNGFGQQPPQLPPQQTGGVFGPSQPLTPLMPQKTGPPPPVRFGVTGPKPLVPQRTGRADLGRATPQNPFGL